MDLYAQKNKSLQNIEELSSYEIKQKGKSMLLYGFKKDSLFKHGDKITNLINARLLEDYNTDSSTAPDTAKYICFEVEKDFDIKKLADHRVFDTLNKMGQFKNLNPDQYNHFGSIYEKDGEYELVEPTQEVLDYVSNELTPKLPLQKSKKEEFNERISFKEEPQIKNINKVSLEEQWRYNKEDKFYIDYKATDIKTKKPLMNIRRLRMVTETPEEMLYSAFVEKINSNNEPERKSFNCLPKGFPILFTSEEKIEEIAESNDQNKIKQFVEFMSNIPVDRLSADEMRFVGSIYKEGMVNKNEENCSEEIKEKIKKEQEDFIKEKEQEKNLENSYEYGD